MPAPQERGECPRSAGEVHQTQLPYDRRRRRIEVDFDLVRKNESSTICISTSRGCSSKGECAPRRCDQEFGAIGRGGRYQICFGGEQALVMLVLGSIVN